MLLPSGVHLLSYADDLALVVPGTVPNKIRTAQKALDLITEKSRELGFKISTAKSKAMAFHLEVPQKKLEIQRTQLDWTTEQLYLGIWLDPQLKFNKQLVNLKERMTARINVMRAMTNPTAGASSNVLRTFYVHAVRPLVDYSAPVLADVTKPQRQNLEVVQNKALRTITGAPGWTKVETMMAETGVIPLDLRVKQLIAGKVAGVLRKSHTSIIRARLGNFVSYLAKSQWVREVANIFTSLVPHWPRLAASADSHDPGYTTPPPWAPPVVTFQSTVLPDAKAQCLTSEMRQIALRQMEQLHQQGCRVYYTDGSVDPTTGASGSAFVAGTDTTSWRVSDHCSTLQTELAAIHGALQHAVQTREERVVVHTDSKTAIQALRRRHQKDNIALTTSILSLAQRMVADGRTVVLNWIPSHVGLKGNDQADTAARVACAHPQVEVNIRPSLTNTRALVRTTTHGRAHQRYQQQLASSSSMRWYRTATDFTPINGALCSTRTIEVATHRLRLGYATIAERIPGGGTLTCRHCGATARKPLLHYLLRCPSTASLRLRRPTEEEVRGNTEEEKAANIVRWACSNSTALVTTLRAALPPR